MAWNYSREESSNFSIIPEGKHRVRISSAEKAISQNGNDMLILKFDVSGYNSSVFHYITFLDDKPEITNRMLTQFFDSFKDIPEGDFDTSHWIGKVGACVIKHESYNGEPRAKISYFIHKDKQSDLPAWSEGSNGDMPVEIVDDEDMPF